MLQVMGGAKRLCNGVTRRELLTIGGLSVCGIGAPIVSQSELRADPTSSTLPGIGRTDAIGATVADRPITAKDILATIYHLIGINPDSTLIDVLNRPVPLVHDGKVVPEMLA